MHGYTHVRIVIIISFYITNILKKNQVQCGAPSTGVTVRQSHSQCLMQNLSNILKHINEVNSCLTCSMVSNRSLAWVWTSARLYLKGVSSFTLPHYIWKSISPYNLPCAQRLPWNNKHFLQVNNNVIKKVWWKVPKANTTACHLDSPLSNGLAWCGWRGLGGNGDWTNGWG